MNWIRRSLVLVTCVSACRHAEVQTTDRPTTDPELPVLINNHFVDAHGQIVGTVREGQASDVARPSEVDSFALGDFVVNARARTVTPGASPPFRREPDRVVRVHEDRTIAWSVPVIAGPADPVVGEGRAVVASSNVLLGLDDATGAEVWRADQAIDRLAIDGQLLLAVGRFELPGGSRWLVARTLETGAERWRTELPVNGDPESIIGLGDRIVVELASPPFTVVYNSDGQEQFRLAEHAELIHIADGPAHEWVVFSDKRLARIDATGQTMWELRGASDRCVADCDLLVLRGTEAIISNASAPSDSSLEVARLDLANGKRAWRARIRRGTSIAGRTATDRHSTYIEARGDEVFVVSQGDQRSAFERLSVANGSSILRREFR